MKRLSGLQSSMLRAAGRILSPGGHYGSLLVLIYHRVLPAPDPLLADEPDASLFAAQMDLLADHFNVIGLSEAAERLARRSLPPRAVAITFDDGYANNLEVAAPILLERRLTATFFIATRFIDGGQMWNDMVIEAVRRAPQDFDLGSLGLGRYALTDMSARRRAVDEILSRLKYLEQPERQRKAEAIAAASGIVDGARTMMTEQQLRKLASLGMEIGAHCVTHPILARLAPEDARREIHESKSRLEEIIRAPVRTFAYPNGRPGTDYGPEHVEMVRAAGFTAAVTTAWGAATVHTDRFQIPRVAPWDRSALKYGLRMLRCFTQRNARTV